MIWCGAMMMDFLGEAASADLILSSIKQLTSQRAVLTPDLGGRATTTQVANAVVEQARLLAA